MLRMKELLLGWPRGLGRALARLSVLLGFRTEPPPRGASSAPSSGCLSVAVRLRRLADATVRSSDLVHPGEHYAIAIRLYGEALECISSDDAVCEQKASGIGSAEPTQDLIQRTFSKHGLTASQVQDAARASVIELMAMAGVERRALALSMQKACGAVLDGLSSDADRVGDYELNRYLRITLVIVTILGLSSLVAQYWDRRGDLAFGKIWRASSELTHCRPVDKGGCPTRRGVFFHTREEENPWIEYDLGKRTTFTSVRVENSRDGFRDRAVPLIVEIGDDQQTWSEVARATRTFEIWSQAFPPVSARYVRFRVPRLVFLHLAKIEIHK